MKKQGEILKNLVKVDKRTATDIAALLGIARDTLYKLFAVDKLDEFYTFKLKSIGIDVEKNVTDSGEKMNLTSDQNAITTENSVNKGGKKDETKNNNHGLRDDNATVASMDNIMYVPLVNQYAYGGYLSGYADQEYVQQLSKIPFMVDKEYRGTYMCFEVRGDSMDVDKKLNYSNGDIVLGREIGKDHWKNDLHIDKWPAFVIVHEERGIIIKQITAHNVKTGDITCHSFNPLYKDFVVNLSEVKQLFNVIKKQAD